MITKGYIDANGLPRVEVRVFGGRGEASLEAIIDTGFDGDICLPIRIAVQLGLELAGVTMVELADGTIKRELTFLGAIQLDELKREVEILLTEGRDTLIGANLLRGLSLNINFAKKTVEIRETASTS